MTPNVLVPGCLKVLGMDACGLQRKRRPTILVGPSSISNVPPLRKTDAGAEDRHQGDRPWPHGLVVLDTQGIFPHTIPTLATIKDRGIESHG